VFDLTDPATAPGASETKKPRKEKEVFEIDFFASEEVDERHDFCDWWSEY
jgi:hypothetical protein